MPPVTELSEVKRNLLQSLIHGGAVPRIPASQAIVKSLSTQYPPLTLSQERLVLRESTRPALPSPYNECVLLRMFGELSITALQDSFSEIVRRHENWRTTYIVNSQEILQKINSVSARIDMPLIDLCGLSIEAQEQQIERLIGPLVQRPFDLREGPLLRVRLVRINSLEYRLYLIAHLSILDGLSAYQIFPFELAALYRAKIRAESPNLPPLAVQFSDYSRWQRHPEHSREIEKELEYWRVQLQGNVPPLNWPVDRARPAQETFRGTIYPFVLSTPLSSSIKALARKHGVTLFVTLLSLLAALLYSYTRQDDFAIGTPSPCGRKRSELQNLLGYLLTPVALRFRIGKGMSFSELLSKAQKLTLEAISNDDLPVELLAEKLNLHSDRSRNPLFTIATSLQPAMPRLDVDWIVTSMDVNSGGAPWDLYLAFIDRREEILGRLQYNPDLFETETISRTIHDYQEIAQLVSSNPLIPLSQITLASD